MSQFKIEDRKDWPSIEEQTKIADEFPKAFKKVLYLVENSGEISQKHITYLMYMSTEQLNKSTDELNKLTKVLLGLTGLLFVVGVFQVIEIIRTWFVG